MNLNNTSFTAAGWPEEASLKDFSFILEHSATTTPEEISSNQAYIIGYVGAHRRQGLESLAAAATPAELTPSQLAIIDDIIRAAQTVFSDCGLDLRPFDLANDILAYHHDDFTKVVQLGKNGSFDWSVMPLGLYYQGKIIMDADAEDTVFSWLFAHEFCHFQAGTIEKWRPTDTKPNFVSNNSGFRTITNDQKSYIGLCEGTTELFGFIFRSFYFKPELAKPWHTLRMSYGAEPLYIYDLLRTDKGLDIKLAARLLRAYLASDTNIWEELIPKEDFRNGLIYSTSLVESAKLIKNYNDPRFHGQYIFDELGV